ncbi:orotate phosphoribosyltransferase [Pyrolobus fumarii 1A]|uniref:Orotate phosphoribosyltransferase n=1 Tax=Pyrolobus fumarii (strain DSM 11204 / 1A) TaxID=694429 RepID=G0EEZ3_PYRF1|nr:orotate phosphoribosyltransferase [Pyrolobus fumarii]AEM38107.1 orotate phosphoribosyltransferase [Pyrolobus fumarii 1A]
MTNAKLTLVRELLEAGGLRIGGEYRLRSGTVSRIYIDARRLYSRPLGRRVAAFLLARSVEELGATYDAVVGVATGGIGWGVLVAEVLGVASGYVRPEPKDHGLRRLVEGVEEGSRIVIVDDVATTGGALLDAVRAAEASGYRVVGAVVIFDRCMGAAERMDEAGIPYKRVMTIRELLSFARDMGVDTSAAEDEVANLRC